MQQPIKEYDSLPSRTNVSSYRRRKSSPLRIFRTESTRQLPEKHQIVEVMKIGNVEANETYGIRLPKLNLGSTRNLQVVECHEPRTNTDRSSLPLPRMLKNITKYKSQDSFTDVALRNSIET